MTYGDHLRKALATSPHFEELVRGFNVVVLASHPPIAMDDWTAEDVVAAERFAREGGSVPPKIAEYIEQMREAGA